MERALAVVWSGILLYTLVFAAIGWWKLHVSEHTEADLATFSQSYYYTVALGRPLWNTIEPGGHFATHFTPMLLAFAPLFALFPTPFTLIVIQAAGTALGALPLFRLAARHLGIGAGQAVALLYLVYHPLHGITFEMFNENSFVVPAMMWAIEALDRGAMRTFWLAVVVTLCCREDASITLAALGTYMAVTGLQRRHGVALGALGILWFWGVNAVVLPWFNTGTSLSGYFFTLAFGHLGPTPLAALHRILTDPAYMWHFLATPPNFDYVGEMLFPFAFLPLADPALFAVTLPLWGLNLLSGYGPQHIATSHYSAAMVPIFFWATVRRLAVRPRWLPAVGLLMILGMLLLDPSPLRFPFRVPARTPHTALVQRVAAAIPQCLSVSATPEFAVHLCMREHLTLHPGDEADVLLLDTRGDKYLLFRWPDFEAAERGRYRVVFEQDGLRIWARNGLDPHFLEALR